MAVTRAHALSGIEREVILEIRSLRHTPALALPKSVLQDPVRLIHHFIDSSHGNVQLTLRPMATELGIEMRTLERAFRRRYGTTMEGYQTKVRFDFSCWMLNIVPSIKMSAIAATLGYRRVQDFNRFFRKQAGTSPALWRASQREKNAENNG